MGRLISLQAPACDQKIPSYLILSLNDDRDAKELFYLGTRVMRWSENLWIIDLAGVLSYWHWWAKKEGRGFFQHLQVILGRLDSTRLWALSNHPWQGVLFFHLLASKNSEGLRVLNSPRGQVLFTQQLWDIWPIALEQFKELLTSSQQSSFSQGTRRWEKFIDRMKSPGPFALKHLRPSSIERRFGKWWGIIWGWTFFEESKQEKESHQTDLFTTQELHQFPWRDFVLDELPSVSHSLDHPLLDWQAIAPCLREDLKKLCQNFRSLKLKRVARIDWVLTLENMKDCLCSLVFRHPYFLEQEAPDFETVLFQAHFAYDRLMQSLKTREEDWDYPLQMALVGWKLVIKESVEVSPENIGLWEESKGVELRARLELENKLPLNFEHFRVLPSFLPENSFAEGLQQSPAKINPWLISSLKRPLYIFPEVERVNSKDMRRLSFLERDSSPWWQNEDPERGQRDYFILEDNQRCLWWVYRDHEGEWFRHGIFS